VPESARAIHGAILTGEGFVRGQVTIGRDRQVTAVEGTPLTAVQARDSGLPLVLPGFIDLHVHGGGGADIMEGDGAVQQVAALHLRHGTTSLLATTMTAPRGDLQRAFNALADSCRHKHAGGARVLGVHLEGPYINPGKLGAQPDFARATDMQELANLHRVAPIRLITLAPEMPGNLELIERLCAAGHIVQIGHSLGGYEEGVAALNKGARGFTHLFNAMTGIHHRKPGMVGAALAHAEFAEIIPDLLHVHPGAIRVAMRAIPRLFCVTDSTAAAGMPDGEYRLGRHTVTKCLGGVRLPDGTLAGSTLTMDQALRNLVNDVGLDIADASRRVSTNAADYLGETRRGRIAPGAWADLVVLDRDLALQQVITEGDAIEPA
jgi:N-acetylglucosamine-6-phosphate deacetylase